MIAPAWPDHPVLDATVHDAMELGDPPQRRFHMSAMDNGTRGIVVLDAVQPVLLRNIKASERRRAVGLVQESMLDGPQRARVVEAAVAAAERWFCRRIGIRREPVCFRSAHRGCALRKGRIATGTALFAIPCTRSSCKRG